jgi:hypothetical protein
MTFVDYVTPIPADWLNNVNTVVNGGGGPVNIPPNSITNAMMQANSISASNIQTGVVSTKLNTEAINQLTTTHFFQDQGARIQRMNDRQFLGTATLNDGLNTQVAGDWTFSQYAVGGVGAFAYLEHWGTLNVGTPNGQPAIVATVRTSDSGSAGNAGIGVSSVVVNDNTFGPGANGWNYYATAVRGVGSTGASTIGMETDVTNLGSFAPIFPSNMFPNGLTANLWVAAGGELPFQGGSYTYNNVSCAIGIFANQPGTATNCVYDKGIVFGVNALNSNNCAIAFATGHAMVWFGSTNASTNFIQSNTTAVGAAFNHGILFNNFGTGVVDGSGNTLFLVQGGTSNPTSRITVQAGTVGQGAFIEAVSGSETNVNLNLRTQGTGVVTFGTFTGTSGITQTGYITILDAAGTTRRLLVG